MVEWRDIKVVVFRRAGKWISGIVLQKNEEGKRRLKLFKGLIKGSGGLEVEWKGEKLKVSMIQRFNIPSRKYWNSLKAEIEKLIDELGEAEEEEGQESLEKFV